MSGAVFLAGDGVELRTVERADVPFLYRWNNDPEMRRATGGQSVPFTLAEEYQSYEAALADGDSVALLVYRDDDPVGGVELDVANEEADVVEIAYWLVPEARGTGIAQDAVGTLLDYAFGELGAHRVHGEVFAFNERSAGLLRRLGFSEEGRLRENYFADGRYYDTLVFGLLAGER